jgi:UDP-2,3-diacylglucosamine pyrophosphatase LpxH
VATTTVAHSAIEISRAHQSPMSKTEGPRYLIHVRAFDVMGNFHHRVRENDLHRIKSIVRYFYKVRCFHGCSNDRGFHHRFEISFHGQCRAFVMHAKEYEFGVQIVTHGGTHTAEIHQSHRRKRNYLNSPAWLRLILSLWSF